jgi:hypothetical protein
MTEIKSTNSLYKEEAIDAEIIGNYIISGKAGKEIDYETTYDKMKKYGTYNESLTTLKEVKPTISIEDNYDKYIVRGNRNNRNVALVFTITKKTDITNILSTLEKTNTTATFFIDGTYLESNSNFIKTLTNYELEVLGYNNTYNKSIYETTISYLNTLTKKEAKYCYTEKDNSKLLKLCKSLNLHTIKPTLIINKNIYNEIKTNLTNSLIISLKVNKEVENKLEVVINYIKSKGYYLTTLDELVSESN